MVRFVVIAFVVEREKPPLVWLNVNGQILFVCFYPPHDCREKINAFPNCHKCNKKCYPFPVVTDIFTGFDFCSDNCKNNSGLGDPTPNPDIVLRTTAIDIVNCYWTTHQATLIGQNKNTVLGGANWENSINTKSGATAINRERDRLINLIDNARSTEFPPPETLEQARIRAKNTIQHLFQNKQIKPSDLDSNLWINKNNWETYLEELATIPVINQFVNKMEQAINSFKAKQTKTPPQDNKNSLPTWIISGVIIVLLTFAIIVFRKKYALKK